jgi:hypothetical protein
MGGKEREACGRCAMTSVTGLTMADERQADAADRDPFGEARIEVADEEMRRVSPSAWLEGIVGRINDAATHLTYGRR